MNLKRWIASLLAPEVFRKADRFDRMVADIEQGRRWLAYDYPEVGAFASHLLDNNGPAGRLRFAGDEWGGSIEQLRERFRRGEARVHVKA